MCVQNSSVDILESTAKFEQWKRFVSMKHQSLTFSKKHTLLHHSGAFYVWYSVRKWLVPNVCPTTFELDNTLYFSVRNNASFTFCESLQCLYQSVSIKRFTNAQLLLKTLSCSNVQTPYVLIRQNRSQELRILNPLSSEIMLRNPITWNSCKKALHSCNNRSCSKFVREMAIQYNEEHSSTAFHRVL